MSTPPRSAQRAEKKPRSIQGNRGGERGATEPHAEDRVAQPRADREREAGATGYLAIIEGCIET